MSESVNEILAEAAMPATQAAEHPVMTIGNLPRMCMSCHKAHATRVLLNAKGRKQYRCEKCFACNNVSGFGRK